MTDKVVDIGKKEGGKLWVCLVCHEHWHGVNPKCPNCKSFSVIEDQIHYVPDSHDVFTCRCNKNPYFKIARHPKHGTYFKCIVCGMKHSLTELGLQLIG